MMECTATNQIDCTLSPSDNEIENVLMGSTRVNPSKLEKTLQASQTNDRLTSLSCSQLKQTGNGSYDCSRSECLEKDVLIK